MNFILQEKRVIFTHAQDFLIIASRSNDHPGIVYCKQKSRSLGEIVNGLVLIDEVYSSEEIVGRVEYL